MSCEQEVVRSWGSLYAFCRFLVGIQSTSFILYESNCLKPISSVFVA